MPQADVTYQQVLDNLPAGSFTEGADDVTVSLKTLTGNASVQLADEAVAESITKLLAACSAAQVTANEDADTNISSYPNPNFGAPIADGNGGFTSQRTHSVNVQVPIDLDETTASSS